MLSQKKGEKRQVKISKFTVEDREDYYISLFGIYGQINAMLTIILPEKLLLSACRIFITDDDLQEQLYDALVEYTNIVASKIKTSFILHKIDVEITLPRVFKKTSHAIEFFGDRKGVFIELDFEGERLKLFLSK
jgi:CheY-specific phosphatase CheX